MPVLQETVLPAQELDCTEHSISGRERFQADLAAAQKEQTQQQAAQSYKDPFSINDLTVLLHSNTWMDVKDLSTNPPKVVYAVEHHGHKLELTPDAVTQIAAIMDEGKQKYGNDIFRPGKAHSEVCGAIHDVLAALEKSQENSERTGQAPTGPPAQNLESKTNAQPEVAAAPSPTGETRQKNRDLNDPLEKRYAQLIQEVQGLESAFRFSEPLKLGVSRYLFEKGKEPDTLLVGRDEAIPVVTPDILTLMTERIAAYQLEHRSLPFNNPDLSKPLDFSVEQAIIGLNKEMTKAEKQNLREGAPIKLGEETIDALLEYVQDFGRATKFLRAQGIDILAPENQRVRDNMRAGFESTFQSILMMPR